MKKKFLIILVLIICLVSIFKGAALFRGITAVFNAKPNLQFPVMSDIHLGEAKESDYFIRALNDYKKIAPNYRAIAIVGDITNHGLVSQYDIFNQIMKENVGNNVEKILTIGNHEFFEGKNWPKPGLTDNVFVERFVQSTGMPGVYYDKWVEGYHFITLGSEESRISNPDNLDNAIISDLQYNWLERTLPINADPKKPIFVFLHNPIQNTVYGSDQYEDQPDAGALKDGRLLKILKQYPQVILFSGHSHYLLNHPRTVDQNGFTQVNTGSVAYAWFEGGEGASQYSQGLLVNVYDDRVEIKAREFTNSSFISTYTVKLPYNGEITDTEKPYFAEGVQPSIESISNNEITLSWDSAKDNTMVDKYYIKSNGKIIKTEYVNFYQDGDFKKVYTKISNLKNNSEYIFNICAVDAWNNESSNELQVKVLIP